MNTQDSEFLECYKKLDLKLQKELGEGVTASKYIENMQEKAEERRLSAKELQLLKTLKHLRYVRNKIAHETSADGFCTAEDLASLKSVSRILFSKPKAQSNKKAAQKSGRENRSEESEMNPLAVTLVLFSAVAIIIAIFYFISYIM